MPVEIEPNQYLITITLDNGLKTKDYFISITVLELQAPYFLEQDWENIKTIQIIQGNSKDLTIPEAKDHQGYSVTMSLSAR